MLGQFEAFPCGLEREETGAINLRPGVPATRPRRPLDLDVVAAEGLGVVVVTGECPGMDGLAPFLADGPQFEVGALGFDADFFLELPDGGIQQIFARLQFAFGDGPDIVVPIGEPRSTGMGNEYLHPTTPLPIHQEPGADAGSSMSVLRGVDGHGKLEGNVEGKGRRTLQKTYQELPWTRNRHGHHNSVQLTPFSFFRTARTLSVHGSSRFRLN